MWELFEAGAAHLSHDLPCLACGHAAHTYLPCDADCGCVRSPIPGRYDESELLVRLT